MVDSYLYMYIWQLSTWQMEHLGIYIYICVCVCVYVHSLRVLVTTGCKGKQPLEDIAEYHPTNTKRLGFHSGREFAGLGAVHWGLTVPCKIKIKIQFHESRVFALSCTGERYCSFSPCKRPALYIPAGPHSYINLLARCYPVDQYNSRYL